MGPEATHTYVPVDEVAAAVWQILACGRNGSPVRMGDGDRGRGVSGNKFRQMLDVAPFDQHTGRMSSVYHDDSVEPTDPAYPGRTDAEQVDGTTATGPIDHQAATGGDPEPGFPTGPEHGMTGANVGGMTPGFPRGPEHDQIEEGDQQPDPGFPVGPTHGNQHLR